MSAPPSEVDQTPGVVAAPTTETTVPAPPKPDPETTTQPAPTATSTVPAPSPTDAPPTAAVPVPPPAVPTAPAVSAAPTAAPVKDPPQPPSHVPSSSGSAATAAAVAPPPSRSSSKSKKKKASAIIMATAAAAQGGSIGAQGENTGRWTAEEHRLFLQGLELHGKGWKKIASLIKSRTVVQIRTHAQKYFQKLAKARQNGEEGEVCMEGRGGAASVTAVSPTAAAQNSKRRRQTTGTKRKVIQSVVASAHRHGKKYGLTGPDGQPLPAPAPALAHFVLPVAPSHGGNKSCVPSITTAQGTISGPALEDSLFRFLTPVPVAPEPQVNEIARSAGANPITLPTENPSSAGSGADIGSPTGVTELSVYPSWTDAKDTPSWYAKGADVDALVDVADTLEWLADTGDLHESYQPPAVESSPEGMEEENPDHLASAPPASSEHHTLEAAEPSITDMSVSALPSVDANNVDSVIPPLPSLFDGSTDDIAESMKKSHPGSTSVLHMEKAMSSHSIDDHLQVFDSPMEEHDFVSTILENAHDSHNDLAALG